MANRHSWAVGNLSETTYPSRTKDECEDALPLARGARGERLPRARGASARVTRLCAGSCFMRH